MPLSNFINDYMISIDFLRLHIQTSSAQAAFVVVAPQALNANGRRHLDT